MSILIAEDNYTQRRYLCELLAKNFPDNLPVIEAEDGAAAVDKTLASQPKICILDIQMPKISGVKAARAIWHALPATGIIFWTQFPHEIYINEIRKIVRSISPQPTYGFIHKNNSEAKLLRFIAVVLEDGANMIDPLFKDSFQRPLLTEFEAEALRYLALGLSNWAIARKCSLSQRGVESRLATLYEKLFSENFGSTDVTAKAKAETSETYEKLAYNPRTRAFCEALKRGLINSDEIEKAESELADWLTKDSLRFQEEEQTESGRR